MIRLTDSLPLRPPPGFADVQGSRVLFTPPGEGVPVRATGTEWRSEPLGDGRAILRDATGESWGIFGNVQTCAETAERLSR